MTHYNIKNCITKQQNVQHYIYTQIDICIIHETNTLRYEGAWTPGLF